MTIINTTVPQVALEDVNWSGFYADQFLTALSLLVFSAESGRIDRYWDDQALEALRGIPLSERKAARGVLHRARTWANAAHLVASELRAENPGTVYRVHSRDGAWFVAAHEGLAVRIVTDHDTQHEALRAAMLYDIAGE